VASGKRASTNKYLSYLQSNTVFSRANSHNMWIKLVLMYKSELEFEREIAKGERIYIEYQDRPLFGLCEK